MKNFWNRWTDMQDYAAYCLEDRDYDEAREMFLAKYPGNLAILVAVFEMANTWDDADAA